jgi:hypothetical protein
MNMENQMATHYYVMWRPGGADYFFLTHIPSESPTLSVGELIWLACEQEDIDTEDPYEIGSILRVDGSGGPAVALH